jgi:hypothetical protein
MTRIIESRARWISMITLAWALGGWHTGAMAQEGSPPVPPLDPLPRAAVSPADSQQELVDRLRRMEERLDQVTKQNDELSREVQDLKSANRAQRQQFPPAPAARRPDPDEGDADFSGGGRGSSYSISSSLGGGSASGGGDPTTSGRAQVVGNRQLGKLSVMGGYYDYDNDGLRWGTDDDEFNFGIRAMQQLDARIYANPNQEYASSGITNPRTRVYFYGHLTRWDRSPKWSQFRSGGRQRYELMCRMRRNRRVRRRCSARCEKRGVQSDQELGVAKLDTDGPARRSC